MEYHDNDVTIELSSPYLIISGSYTVESFYVTIGQDPANHIYQGLTASFGSNGTMSFSVGRKGDPATASWFNARIANWQNTFNHGAGELNFAFLGTLKMTITGGILGNGNDSFTFSDVALAQGHAGASNNWWFGGLACTYTINDSVTCLGVNSEGKEIIFTFARGGNNVSTVLATPTTLIDTATWMGKLSDDLRLDELVMPGSHDAGMSDLSHCNPPVLANPITQTQADSIGDQLLNGSRYFDIRVDFDHGQLVTYHRTGDYGCDGQDLKSIFDETAHFLDENHRETAIFKISHIRDDGGDHNPIAIKAAIEGFLNNYNFILFRNPQYDINLAGVHLGEVRGKLILVFDYPEYINPGTGRFHYADGDSEQSNYNLTVFDQFTGTDDGTEMETDQLQKWASHAGLGQGFLFLLSWILTPTADPLEPPLRKLAESVNISLPYVLYNQIKEGNAAKPNIVLLDYLDHATSQSIIMYNF